jgi:hypothetical protein
MARSTNNDIHPTKLAYQKIAFIKEFFPEYINCDPYRDYALVERISLSMIRAGIYKQKYAENSPAIRSAVINYIRKAKNEKVKNFKVGSRNVA